MPEVLLYGSILAAILNQAYREDNTYADHDQHGSRTAKQTFHVPAENPNAFLISKMLLLCKYFSSNRYDVDYLKKYYIKEESDFTTVKRLKSAD